MQLRDIGEIEFLVRYVQPALHLSDIDINNDCVSLPLPERGTLVWSTDPAPSPVARLLGYDDPKILAWYAAVVNFSDIAANGGQPIGLLVCVDLPETTDVEYYQQFNDGLQEACDRASARLLGGNVRCSPQCNVAGTALGVVKGRVLGRCGVLPGYRIYTVGRVGYFWAAVLADRYKIAVPAELRAQITQALCFPTAQITAGTLISSFPSEIACMDSSDGIFNCCYQLARMNNVGIVLFDEIWDLPDELRAIYKACKVDPAAGCYAFGDWPLVCAVPSDVSSDFEILLRSSNVIVTCIGRATDGHGDVYFERTGESINPLLLNENFKGGYSQHQTIDDLVSHYLNTPLVVAKPE